jgi:hypothetical protein
MKEKRRRREGDRKIGKGGREKEAKRRRDGERKK